MIANALFLIAFPSGGELILIIAVVVLIFGGKKIPELMRGVGQGIREFNDAKATVKKEIEKGMNDKPEKSDSPERSEESKSANSN
ncbi:MAG: Sec-independent protein translocase subunit TatA/TatB [Bacteroidia bacterium]